MGRAIPGRSGSPGRSRRNLTVIGAFRAWTWRRGNAIRRSLPFTRRRCRHAEPCSAGSRIPSSCSDREPVRGRYGIAHGPRTCRRNKRIHRNRGTIRMSTGRMKKRIPHIAPVSAAVLGRGVRAVALAALSVFVNIGESHPSQIPIPKIRLRGRTTRVLWTSRRCRTSCS